MWHYRLGHLSIPTIMATKSVTSGILTSDTDLRLASESLARNCWCGVCAAANIRVHPVRSTTPTTHVAGTSPPRSRDQSTNNCAPPVAPSTSSIPNHISAENSKALTPCGSQKILPPPLGSAVHIDNVFHSPSNALSPSLPEPDLQPLDLVHLDLVGPFVKSVGGSKFALIAHDSSTNKREVVILKEKGFFVRHLKTSVLVTFFFIYITLHSHIYTR